MSKSVLSTALFVGIDFPPSVNEELKRIQQKLKAHDPSAKYQPPEKLHLTLRYIGPYPNHEEVISALSKISYDRYQLQLNELGMFKNPRKNVVWVDVKGDMESLLALRQMVDDTFSRAGVQMKQQKFVPHISLAFRSKAAIREQFSSCGVNPVVFDVPSFHLYVSTRTPAGSQYSKVRTFELKKQS